MTYEEYKKNVLSNKNATMFARDSYSSRLISNETLMKTGGYKPYESKYAFNPDLDTSEGLYKLANQAGLKEDADRVIKRVGGDPHEFFSGGFVSDVMDVLNIGSYGMVGVLKGKGFTEGVKNRETFSDEDSLGQYGFTGKMAGMVLDIVVDPTTYVAPWKLVTKIPGVANKLDGATTRLVGELTPIQIGEKEVNLRVGGWTPLTFLANKFVYGFGMDKSVLTGMQETIDRAGVKTAEAEELITAIAKIDPKVADQALEWKTDGVSDWIGRKSLTDLQRTLTKEQMDVVRPIYETIERNADELVELGRLSSKTRDKYIDDYVVQMYEEYAVAKAATPGSGRKSMSLNYRQRKELTKEWKQEKKIIENSSVVFGATLLKQINDIKNARLQDFLSKSVAVDADDLARSGADPKMFRQVPDSPNYQLNKGREIDIKEDLTALKKALKVTSKERNAAVKDHKSLLKEIDGLDSTLNNLSKMSEEELGYALSGLKKFFRENGVKLGSQKKAPTSEGQKALASSLKKWLNRGRKSDRLAREQFNSPQLLDEFLQTREGLALERAFNDPQMMYQWRSIEEFFDAVRYPDKKIIQQELRDEYVGMSDEAAKKMIEKTEEYQRKFGELTNIKDILSTTNLKVVEDVMNKLEDRYADLLFQKKGILEALEENAMGNLAGKYLPKEVWEMVQGTFEPKAQFGETAVLWFKHAKVIWSPAAYPRNMLSAMIQNWWKLGIGPWRADLYIDAYKEFKNKGPVLREMQKHGFHETSGVTNELTQNYIQSKLIGDAISKTTGQPISKVKQQLKRFDKWAVGAYGHIDNIAKVAAYKYARKNGRSEVDALADAYTATFNYSHVTPFVHQMRRAIWGVPFITFNLKAAPLVLDTIKNNPQRISFFGKAQNALFQAAGVEAEQEAEAQPAWMRDSAFMLRLPWKDSEGRAMYFDLTYIVPFGAIASGEYLRDPIATNPVLQTVRELSQNKTFGGQKIFNESDDIDTVVSDIFIHVSKLALPPPFAEQLPKGYQEDGTRIMGTYSNFTGNTQDRGPNERSFYQEMFRLAGMGVQPYDLESRERQFDFKRKQALQQMLSQNGILEQFQVPYLPEESPMNPQNVQPSISDRDVNPIGR